MIQVIEDGLDTYVVIKDDYVLGWISRSRYHGKWRALKPHGDLSFHYTRGAALDALGA